MNGLVKTLVAEAAAEQEASSFDQAIKEMLQETVVPQVKYLPNSVIQFTENITKNFSKTAELLIIRANELEIAAAELREMAEKKVSDKQMEKVTERFPINPPMSKEEYWYRTIFETHFPSASAAHTVPSVPSVACSTAVALEWDASFKNRIDPSGRAVQTVHTEAY